MSEFNIIKFAFDKMGLGIEVSGANVHVFTSVLIVFVLACMGVGVYRKTRNVAAMLVPPPRICAYNLFELITQTIWNFLRGIFGDDDTAGRYLPLVATLFIYIFICNVIGLIPGFVSPTDNLNTTLSCAVVVFVYYNYVGIRMHGLRRYISHMLGPIKWLAPFMLLAELVNHLARPFSMGVRLYGNIVGDHIVIGVFSQLMPVVLPIIFMLLALFIAFMQAFIFSMLTVIYISLAVSDANKREV